MMRKIISLFLSFAIFLGMWGANLPGIFDKNIPGNVHSEEPDAYDLYQAAMLVTVGSGSWTEELTMRADMAIVYGSNKSKTELSLQSNMDVSGYSKNDSSDLLMSGSAKMNLMGQTYAWDTRYEDGMAYYEFTKPTKTTMKLRMKPGCFDFGTLTRDMLENAEVSGNQITFTILGNKMDLAGMAVVNLISGFTDLEYGNIDVAVSLNQATGTIDDIVMTFHASMNVQGYQAEVSYIIDYRFKPQIKAEINVDTSFADFVIKVGQEEKIKYSLLLNGESAPIQNYTVDISNPRVVEVVDSAPYNDSQVVRIKGLEAGTSKLLFTDNATGAQYAISLTVEADLQKEQSFTRTEWINKHKEYAQSDRYQSQIRQGFSGALEDALEDVKNNGMITAYNTLDSVNKILDFDLDLSESQEYELLLGQILFSRSGVESIEGVYEEYLADAVVDFTEVFLKLPELASEQDKDKIESYLQIKDTVAALINGTSDISSEMNNLLNQMEKVKSVDFSKSFLEACDKAGIQFAAGLMEDQFDLTYGTMKDVVLYLAAGEAYCNTSDTFADMLISLRKHINIPSENPLFEPYPVKEAVVDESEIVRLLGIGEGYDEKRANPLNSPIYLSTLATAIEDYYMSLEKYRQEGARSIALNSAAEYVEGTADNLLDNSIDVAISLFDCLPVVKEFSAIKDFFQGAQFVIDRFTGIDDRAYLGTMVMRLYAIVYIHYLTVDNLAGDADAWGMRRTENSVNQELDEDAQFADATRFDESVAVYRAILSVAAEYAREYYTTYYETIDNILSKYAGYQPSRPTYVNTESDTFKSVKQKIIELQMQQISLAYNWCHSTGSIYNRLQGIKFYGTESLRLYSFKCPVEVTFLNEFGDTIAKLSGGNEMVEPGYEQYFYTSEVVSGTGEYVKIAAVPRTYQVMIAGTGTGEMDISVSEYEAGVLGETKQYFNIPVSEETYGYLTEASESGRSKSESSGSKTSDSENEITLVIDGSVCEEGDYAGDGLPQIKLIIMCMLAISVGAFLLALLIVIMRRVTAGIKQASKRKKAEKQRKAALEMYRLCTNCGNQIPKDAGFCRFCGSRVGKKQSGK